MPDKPQKFVVILAVNVAVFADDEFEARKKAQGWLQKNVRHDSTVDVNLVIVHRRRSLTDVCYEPTYLNGDALKLSALRRTPRPIGEFVQVRHLRIMILIQVYAFAYQ